MKKLMTLMLGLSLAFGVAGRVRTGSTRPSRRRRKRKVKKSQEGDEDDDDNGDEDRRRSKFRPGTDFSRLRADSASISGPRGFNS